MVWYAGCVAGCGLRLGSERVMGGLCVGFLGFVPVPSLELNLLLLRVGSRGDKCIEESLSSSLIG